MVKIAVFCSSSENIDRVYYADANELGREMGERGHDLVYGGCARGLMKEVADAFHKNGRRPLGIVPRYFTDLARKGDKLIVVKNLNQRKELLMKKAEAFIALSGGMGTIDEWVSVISARQVDEHNGAIAIINSNGFYDLILRQFEESFGKNFLPKDYKSFFFVTPKVREALDYIENYKPVKIRDPREL
jgi:cytokinin riboside 5'-monophosphate phosphoribohydrolase